MRPIQVYLHKQVIQQFSKDAKRAFPHEKWAALLGREHRIADSRRIEVIELFYPEDVDRFCTTGCVEIQDIWYVDAEEHAEEQGLELVGDIHSHPYSFDEVTAVNVDLSRSELDLQANRWDKLSVIVNIEEYRRKRLRARYRVWGPTVPVEVQTI